MRYLIIILFLVSGCSYDRTWTKQDTIMQSAGSVLWAVEGLQTVDLTERDEYWETNFILGEHPSKGEVYAYFGGAIVGGWVVAYLLSDDIRKYFQGFFIGTSFSSVYHNHTIGLRMTF